MAVAHAFQCVTLGRRSYGPTILNVTCVPSGGEVTVGRFLNIYITCGRRSYGRTFNVNSQNLRGGEVMVVYCMYNTAFEIHQSYVPINITLSITSHSL